MSVYLILYSKPGCHLCEGLQEKLTQIQSLDLELDVRDITTRDDWFQAYQYEIPVLMLVREKERGEEKEARRGEAAEEAIQNPQFPSGAANLRSQTQNASTTPTSEPIASSFIPLPRPSPRANVQQLEQMLRKYLSGV